MALWSRTGRCIVSAVCAGIYVIGTPSLATMTTSDAPTVTVAATDPNAAEIGPAGPDTGTFTFTRTGGDTTSALTVNFTVAGDATGTDYTSLGMSVSIPAGAASATKTVTPVLDALVEANETVVVTLAAEPAGSYVVGMPSAATVTIADAPTVTVVATDPNADETGPDTGTFTFTRTGSTTAALMVNFTVVGDATAGTDYVDVGTSVSIPIGQASATLTVTPFTDAFVEGDETVEVTLAAGIYVIGTPSTATVTIADLPTVTVAATDPNADEAGNPGTFAFTRTGSTALPLTVNFTVGGTATVTADYTDTIGTSVSIPPGQASATKTVTPVQDAAVEADETVVVTLAAGVYVIGTPSTATVTVADAPTVTVSATDASASETGPDPGTFTFTRTGSTAAALTVNFTVGGTATVGTDYVDTLGASVSIPAGQASATKTVTPVQDAAVETDETVVVTLAAGVYVIGTPSTATVTVADAPTVTVVATDASASETGPDPGTFTFTRTGSTAGALTVNFTVGGTASVSDYTSLGTSVTIAAGQASTTKTVTPVVDAAVEADETVAVTLAAGVYVIGTPSTATVTILDVPTVTVVATDATASETGPDPGTLTFTRTGSTTAALTVNFTVGGTATVSTDYADLGTSVSIPAGQTSVTKTVTPILDGLLEANETVVVTVTAGTYLIGAPNTATVTIAVTGGIISGRVLTQSGVALAGVVVSVYDSNNTFVGSASTPADGTYAVGPLATGVYFAKTSNSQGYINRLYETVSCLACGLIGGTPIRVTAGSTTANVDFTLSSGGAIAGSVSGPSGALANIRVQVYSGNGQFLESVATDAGGQYRTAIGLPVGTYFLRTSNKLGFSDELYQDRVCIACNPIGGTPVIVSGTAVTSGIDFSLEAGGRITGTITETGGAPLAGVTVHVYTAAGGLVTSGVTDASGVYATGSEIPPGSYYVRTSNTSGYIDQVHRARECLDCNTSTGTAVAVVAGQPTNGIDFTLRRGGRVTGTVRATTGGAGIAGVTVTIYTTAGTAVSSGVTDAGGVYVGQTGLPTGTYYARTSNRAGFVDEIFNDVTCLSCAPTVGTPIVVTAGQDASGVDFSLASGGAIAGTIVDAATSQPVAHAVVHVYTSTGTLAASAVSDAAGRYRTDDSLGAGRYFVRASSALGYVTELFNNLECAACSPLTGTPVDVVVGQTTQPVDFSLALGGRITGTVTDASSGQVLRDITVSIYNGNNSLVASLQTDATGQFLTAGGLGAGTYFARTQNTQGYIDEIYDVPICLGCAPNTGTAIAVVVGQVTPRIDFQLAPGAQMTGSIIETGTNLTLAGITVEIVDRNASLVTTGVTDSAGQYRTGSGLPNGTYFARTTNEQGYIDKVFDNALCLACDVTRGTPIAVTSPTIVPGVNFSLSLGGRIAGTITATADGAAIGNVRVAIHNAAGALVGASYSNAAGQYISVGLPPGSYRLRTFNRLGFIDEAFDNQRCGPCRMTTVGVAVSVTIATTVTGKNFALDAGGWVSGWVIDAATRAPLAGVTVAFFQNDVFVGRSLPSDASGYYAISLPAGAYTARPDPFQGYMVQLVPGLRAADVGNVTVEVGLETPRVEFPLAACTPPSITTSTLPSATAGQSYAQTLSASGGTGSKTFSHTGGELPPGLSLSAGGQIVGTPTTLGTASFTVAAIDANGCSTTHTFALFACGVTLGETSATFAASAGTRTVSVAANSSDCGWSTSASDSWVTITKGSGTGAGTLEYAVAANPTTAQRTATITIGSQTYTVTQNGQPVQIQPKPPIGTFDTPAAGAIVTGSIAVTGWTLSEVGIDRVEVWRDLTTGETTTPFSSPGHPGDGKVFIARGTFVRGARPDVAGIYSTYPNADRAGWGYLLLTQGLWNVGNGTFTLYAFAYDVDGQVASLGTKTITANNAQATKPFGALDTPGYGATVSGGFWNYGWALTPNGNTTDPRSCVITDGNIYMGIDSQPIVPVHYGDTRTDIAGFFPGFSNGSTAGGAYYIDTTALGNGDHQIGWYVIDSCGRADGIGSRIFTVLNGVNITTDAAPRALAADVMAALVVGDAGPIQVRTDEVARQSLPDEQGVHVIAITQRSRIEVELPKVEGARYRGGEIVGGVELALPLGSSLDAERGVFYWEPAPAFLGTYELVFAAGNGAPLRLRIVVEPQ